MSKRSSIPFAPGAEEPAPEVLDTVKTVSGDLNTALGNASARIELEAFGGKPNDRSSEARRLSLKRALIVRQLLIDEGVPSDRIDVRAMGGANDGSPDRVDIFLRA
jgi:outer membrane protein OmpA-like peptidoglycan-associated protein